METGLVNQNETPNMTSRGIIQEGKFLPDGRLVLPGAVTFSDRPIKLLRSFSAFDPSALISNVQNLRREGDEILCDVDKVEFPERYYDVSGYFFPVTCWVNPVTGKTDRRFISHMSLMSVTIIPKAAWPSDIDLNKEK